MPVYKSLAELGNSTSAILKRVAQEGRDNLIIRSIGDDDAAWNALQELAEIDAGFVAHRVECARKAMAADPSKRGRPKSNLSAKDLEDIAKLRANKTPIATIAKVYNCSVQTIYNRSPRPAK